MEQITATTLPDAAEPIADRRLAEIIGDMIPRPIIPKNGVVPGPDEDLSFLDFLQTIEREEHDGGEMLRERLSQIGFLQLFHRERDRRMNAELDALEGEPKPADERADGVVESVIYLWDEERKPHDLVEMFVDFLEMVEGDERDGGRQILELMAYGDFAERYSRALCDGTQRALGVVKRVKRPPRSEIEQAVLLHARKRLLARGYTERPAWNFRPPGQS